MSCPMYGEAISSAVCLPSADFGAAMASHSRSSRIALAVSSSGSPGPTPTPYKIPLITCISCKSNIKSFSQFLTYIFEKLFEGEPGGGYPKERVVPEQRNKKILDEVRKVTLNQDLISVLKGLDQDLVKGAVAGKQFKELFFANCKDEAIAEYVKTLLA